MSVWAMRLAFVAFAVSVGPMLLPATASAQSSPSAYTYATRFDADRQVTGTIAPDPDGTGPIHYAAVRTTYDAGGRPVRVEKGELSAWQSEAVAPASWSGFSVFSQIDTTYDAMDRKLTDLVSSGGTAYALTQYSYDLDGRVQCTAVRMNPAAYGSLPASACALGTEGSQGPDRITRNVYDAAGQVLAVQKAVGTSLEQNYASYAYNANGKVTGMVDAAGNKSSMAYDGFDRQVQWTFPDPATKGAVNAAAYEAYSYDANGNRLSLRKRDGQVIGYSYDALNRMTVKDIPGGTDADVYYSYDLRGLQLSARFGSSSGAGVIQAYDGFGQLTTSTSSLGGTTLTLSYQYDADGNHTQLSYPDGVYVTYTYDGLDRTVGASWWATATGTVPFLSITYDEQGRRRKTTRGSSATGYSYDSVSRLAGDRQLFVGGSANTNSTYAYNPASQIVAKTRSNNGYAFGGYVTLTRSYASNGLNQYTSGGPATFSYDANGNLTGDGTSSYGYDVENRLTSRGAVTLAYDPNGRLWQTDGGAYGNTRFLYDGDALVAEYDGATGAMRRRYVHGPSVDEPILWDEGSSMDCTGTKVLHPDAQGSIVAVADCSGNPLQVNSYDEYGIPSAGNFTPSFRQRFQYTGQAWIPELGMYYYKARMYSPTLGRFLQADPIGYKDQVNLYAYVANDPVNHADPSGESITEIGFAIVDVAQTVSDIRSGASWGTLAGDALNLGLDAAPVPGLREVKGGIEIARAVEHGAEAVRAERAAARTSTLRPGPHAEGSIPARGPTRNFTPGERAATDRNMAASGCHTCGTREPGTASGHAVPDHQPPSALNPNGGPQQLYPHCASCSRQQGGQVTQEIMRRRRNNE